MLNLSLEMENVLPPPVAEVGEASGDELDIVPGAGGTDSWVHRKEPGQRDKWKLADEMSIIRESSISMCYLKVSKEYEGKARL